jgi:hypothetical protein
MASPPLPRSVPVDTFRIDPTFRRAGVAFAVLVPALAAATVLWSPTGDRVGTAIVMAPFVLAALIAAVEANVARIDLDGESITKRGALRTRSLRFDEITTVAYRTSGREGMNTFVIELYADRVGSRIAIDSRFWDRTNDLVQLARALDPQHRQDPVSARLEAEERWRLGERPGEAT